MPKAFAVFIKESTKDEAEMAHYNVLAGASFKDRAVTVHAAYGPQEVLEGPPAEGVVILEFPSMTAAKEWYFSPDYQAALQHRMNGAAYRAILVEGRDTI